MSTSRRGNRRIISYHKKAAVRGEKERRWRYGYKQRKDRTHKGRGCVWLRFMKIALDSCFASFSSGLTVNRTRC